VKRHAIWLISGGPMQLRAAQEIKRRGYALILSDRDPEAVCRRFSDAFVELDTFDVPGHLAATRELAACYAIKAVLTVAADCHYTVACTAQQLKLPHLSPEISLACRNKVVTRQLLTAGGLLQPDCHTAANYDEALNILAAYPEKSFVIKATDNSGSRGFSTIAPGQHLSLARFEHAKQAGTTGLVIIEEQLEANSDEISEASVETIWQDGKMHWLNWVDRIFPRDLRFFPGVQTVPEVGAGVELGHVNPAQHAGTIQKQVHRDIESAGKLLGMDRQAGGHVLKADIFFSPRGPVILELTPRISGGWDSSASSPARGADLVGGVIDLALGRHLDPADWKKYFTFDTSRVVVMSRTQAGAEDCIGRKFALAQGYVPAAELINQALQKLDKGDYLVPIL
jgi:biotin carboxylase